MRGSCMVTPDFWIGLAGLFAILVIGVFSLP